MLVWKHFRRVQANTIEKRLLNDRGLPSFNLRFFVLNKKGEYAGVAMYASGEQVYATCDENGAEERPLEVFFGRIAHGLMPCCSLARAFLLY